MSCSGVALLATGLRSTRAVDIPNNKVLVSLMCPIPRDRSDFIMRLAASGIWNTTHAATSAPDQSVTNAFLQANPIKRSFSAKSYLARFRRRIQDASHRLHNLEPAGMLDRQLLPACRSQFIEPRSLLFLRDIPRSFQPALFLKPM